MRVVTTFVMWDIETGRELARESYEYAGLVALAKGGTQKNIATQNAQTGQNLENQLYGESRSIQDQELPFLTAQQLNPTGFGAPALGEMKTEAGQAASGAAGTAAEQMRLNAARTGNTASLPAGIGAVNRAAGQNLTDASLGIDLANEKLKQQQREGATGDILGMGGQDLSAALNSLGLSNEGLNTWAGVNKSAGNLWSNVFEPLTGDFAQVAGAGHL